MNRDFANHPVDVEIDVRELLMSVVRKLPYIIVFTCIIAVGTYLGLAQISPKYLAQASILIETGESEFTRVENATPATATVLDKEAITSQVQLIRSRDLARTVAQRLGLADRAEFNSDLAGGSLISDFLTSVGLSKDPSRSSVEERVLEQFATNLTVYAVENSRVITIEFESEDPELAARAANLVAEEYIALQRAAKRETTVDAAKWLESEIEKLGARVQGAEAKVEKYRTTNDLFTGGGQSPATLPQQQLSDLNAELTRVRAARGDARVKAEQIRSSLNSGTALNQTEVLNSPLIQRLVEQQVALRSQIAELSATLLPGHPRMREVTAQITDLDRQILREAQKVLKGLEAESELAAAREGQILQELSQLKSAAARANDAGVDLRALEREAAAQRDLLDSYLRRYREALAHQQGEYLPADARVISRASAPIKPYFPKKGPLTLAAFAAALLLAIAFVIVRELASGRPVRRVVPAPLPVVAEVEPIGGQVRWSDDRGVRRMMPDEPTLSSGQGDHIDESVAIVAGRIIADRYKRIVVTTAEDSDRNARPHAAVALARMIARADQRPVLIDLRGDSANSITLGEGNDLPGFSDLFAGEASFAQVIFRDRESRVHFIPVGLQPLLSTSQNDDRVGLLINALDHTYDHVLLDVADDVIESIAPGCDAAVVVTEFDESDPRTIRARERVSTCSKANIIILRINPATAGMDAVESDESTNGAAA